MQLPEKCRHPRSCASPSLTRSLLMSLRPFLVHLPIFVSLSLLGQLTSRPPPTLLWSTQYWSIGYLPVQRVVLATFVRPFRVGGRDLVFGVQAKFNFIALSGFYDAFTRNFETIKAISFSMSSSHSGRFFPGAIH